MRGQREITGLEARGQRGQGHGITGKPEAGHYDQRIGGPGGPEGTSDGATEVKGGQRKRSLGVTWKTERQSLR